MTLNEAFRDALLKIREAAVAAVLVVFASLHGCAVGAAETSSVNSRFCDPREQFAYKVAMNVGGGSAFVSVALLDQRQDRIDVQRGHSRARLHSSVEEP